MRAGFHLGENFRFLKCLLNRKKFTKPPCSECCGWWGRLIELQLTFWVSCFESNYEFSWICLGFLLFVKCECVGVLNFASPSLHFRLNWCEFTESSWSSLQIKKQNQEFKKSPESTMASTIEVPPNTTNSGQMFYCHQCSHRWRKSQNSVGFFLLIDFPFSWNYFRTSCVHRAI